MMDLMFQIVLPLCLVVAFIWSVYNSGPPTGGSNDDVIIVM